MAGLSGEFQREFRVSQEVSGEFMEFQGCLRAVLECFRSVPGGLKELKESHGIFMGFRGFLKLLWGGFEAY